MQKLLVDFITSLDGYGAAEGWPGWWGLEGPEYLAWLAQQPERDYTILMGANTYPRDHWQDWPRPHLRRLSRCRPRPGCQPNVRRQTPAARVCPHGAYRSTRHAPRFLSSHCCPNRATFPDGGLT